MARIGHVGVRFVVAVCAACIAASASGWAGWGSQPESAAVSQPASSARDVAEVLEPIRAEFNLPSLAAVVIKEGRIVAQGAVGVRKAGGTEPITIDDLFHLGSDTKAMTATLIARLVDEGVMSWSTTVGEVFGERFKKMDPAWKNVTVEQLLRNRGGAPANLDADGLWGRLWKRNGTPKQQRLQLVEGVITRPPAAEPGTKFIYSNAGFAIAGAMAEKITGRAWESLMREKVFEPLGITSAGFGAPGTPLKVDQPWGHRQEGTPVRPGPQADNPPAIGPAGTAHMTLGDWAKFVIAHLRGHRRSPVRETELVKAESFEKMHTAVDGYAMGWGVMTRPWAKGSRPGDTGVTLTHAGSNTMWYCVAWLAPERDLALLIATNQGGQAATRGTDAAAGALLKMLDQMPAGETGKSGGAGER